MVFRKKPSPKEYTHKEVGSLLDNPDFVKELESSSGPRFDARNKNDKKFWRKQERKRGIKTNLRSMKGTAGTWEGAASSQKADPKTTLDTLNEAAQRRDEAERESGATPPEASGEKPPTKELVVYQDSARRWKVGVLTEEPSDIKIGQDEGKVRFKVEGDDGYVIAAKKPKIFKPVSPSARFKLNNKEYSVQGNYTVGPRGEVEYTLRSTDGEVIPHVDVTLLESVSKAERSLEAIQSKLGPLTERIEGLAGIKSKRLIADFYALQARLKEMGKLMSPGKWNEGEMEEVMAMSQAITQFRSQIEADLGMLSKDLKKYERGPGRRKKLATEVKTAYQLRLAAEDRDAQQKYDRYIKDLPGINAAQRAAGKPEFPQAPLILPSESEVSKNALRYKIFKEHEAKVDDPWVQDVFDTVAEQAKIVLQREVEPTREGVEKALGETLVADKVKRVNELQTRAKQYDERIRKNHGRVEEISEQEQPLQTELAGLVKEKGRLSRYLSRADKILTDTAQDPQNLRAYQAVLERELKESQAREREKELKNAADEQEQKMSKKLEVITRNKHNADIDVRNAEGRIQEIKTEQGTLTARQNELARLIEESLQKEKQIEEGPKLLQPQIEALRAEIAEDEKDLATRPADTKFKISLRERLQQAIDAKKVRLEELQKRVGATEEGTLALAKERDEEIERRRLLKEESRENERKLEIQAEALDFEQKRLAARRRLFDALTADEAALTQEITDHQAAHTNVPDKPEIPADEEIEYRHRLKKELQTITEQLEGKAPVLQRGLERYAVLKERYDQVVARETALNQQLRTLETEKTGLEQQIVADDGALKVVNVELTQVQEEIDKQVADHLVGLAYNKLDEYERERSDAPVFNFAEEKKSLVDEVGKTRQLIEAQKNPAVKNELSAALSSIEREVINAEQSDPNLENEFLDHWKGLSQLKVRLVEAGGAQERGEVKARAIEIPSYVLEELLKGHGPELKRVMEELYLSKINYVTQKVREGKKEKEVTFISATPAVTEALKNIFSSDTPPSGEMLAQLRQLGIKDWSRFKELWDTHYAKQVGMILHERIQDTIDTALVRAKEQRIQEEEQARAGFMNRLKGFFKPKASVYRNNETDKEHKERIRREREEMTQRLMTGEYLDPRNPLSELSGNAQEKLVQLLAHATQQVGVEVKLAQAKDDAERKQIVAEQGLALEGYQVEGNKLVTKKAKPGEKLFGIAKAAAETGTLLRDLTPEEESEAENEMQELLQGTRDLMKELRDFQEGRRVVFSEANRSDLARNLKQIEFIVRGNEEAPRKLVVVLEHNPILATQARRLLADKEHLGGLEKTQWNPFTERPLLVGESRTREDFQRVAAALERHEEQYKKLIRSDINAELGRQHSKLAFVFGLGVAVMGSMYAGPKIADALGPGLYVPNIEIVRQRDQEEAAKRKREKQYSVRSGTEAARVTINDEAEVGNIAEKRMTTATIEWSLPKVAAFEKAAQSTSGLSVAEVSARTSTIQDIVAGIKDPKDRVAAAKGVYFLAGSVEQGSEPSKIQLKDLMTKAGDKDQETTVIQVLVELGKKVTKKSPEIKLPEDKRTGEQLASELGALESKYGTQDAYEKSHKGSEAFMVWAPDVLKARLKIGPLYKAGAGKLDIKGQLQAYLFDTAMMLSRIRAESGGYPAQVTRSKGEVAALGLPQLAPSTVTEFCPTQPITDIQVQLTCGFAENLHKSDLHKGSAVETLIAYVSSNSKLENYKKGAKAALGSDSPEKVMEWLDKGGPHANSNDKDAKADYQKISRYVRKNLAATEQLVTNHGWFNELLQRPEFKQLWEKELSGKLPEFGLEGAPEQVATKAPETPPKG